MCRSRGVPPDSGRILAGLGLGLCCVEQFPDSQTAWTGGQSRCCSHSQKHSIGFGWDKVPGQIILCIEVPA